jgi:hypothetical protein
MRSQSPCPPGGIRAAAVTGARFGRANGPAPATQPPILTPRPTVTQADSYVWGAICGAGAIIADCTGRNPNVFYEIGIAHTIGKQVILLSQDVEDVPADLRYYRYLLYTPTESGQEELQEKLSQTVKATLVIY